MYLTWKLGLHWLSAVLKKNIEDRESGYGQEGVMNLGLGTSAGIGE